MITTTKNLTIPKGIGKTESVSFDELRNIQRRLLTGNMTEHDKWWLDAILSALQTGRLS